jgi:hypothetical protein
MTYDNIMRPSPMPGEAIKEIDELITVARSWGWDPETSFIVAAQLRGNGMSASEARRLFDDASRRLQ